MTADTAGHGAVCRVRVGKTHEASPTGKLLVTSYASSTDPSLKIRKEMHNKYWNGTPTHNTHTTYIIPSCSQQSSNHQRMSSFGFGIFSQVSYLLSVFAGQHVCQRCHGHPAHVLGGTIRFYIMSRLNLEKLESL